MPGRDVVVFVSHSGNTSECVTAAAQLIRRGITTLALTGRQGILAHKNIIHVGNENYDCMHRCTYIIDMHAD